LVAKFPKEIDELIIVVRYFHDKIRNYVGKEFYGRPVKFVQQPENIHGTYAAVKCCQKLFKSDERFFVFYADDLISKTAIKNCLKHKYAIAASEVVEPHRFGVLQLNDDGSLAGIIEKPEKPVGNLVLTNTLLLDRKILQFEPKINSNGEQYLTHALCDLVKTEKVQVIKTADWLPIGYPEDLKKAEAFLRKF
jgi:bifunctional UDP-N-acetylglucosamine pyrophosphorylase/glucosamine-1-phosphate N-acetyltransferase